MKNVKGNICYAFNIANDLGGWVEPLHAIMTGIRGRDNSSLTKDMYSKLKSAQLCLVKISVLIKLCLFYIKQSKPVKIRRYNGSEY